MVAPAPVQLLVEGVTRSSSSSTAGLTERRGLSLRAACRRGVRANSLRIQERTVMGNLLSGGGRLRDNGRTTSRARRPGAVGPVRGWPGGVVPSVFERGATIA